MSTEERSEFLRWHQAWKDQIFDFRREMEEYCRSDVDILRRSMMVFRDLLLSITEERETVINPKTNRRETKVTHRGVDPTESLTIASVCMNVYKRKFLKKYQRVKVNGTWYPLETADEGEEVLHYQKEWISLEDLERRGIEVQEKEELPSGIASVPSEGYIAKDHYSKASIQWLEWVAH